MNRNTTAALLAVLFGLPALHAATFTWDAGDVTSTSWGAANNWNPNATPTFNNVADLEFNVTTKPNTFLGAAARTIRSLSFGVDVDSALSVSFNDFNGATTARNLTFDTDAVGGNAAINVASGATGNITLGSSGTGTFGNVVLADNLLVTHNGTGRLLFNRNITGTGFSLTKAGTGTMETTNNNAFTGSLTVEAGRLIVGANDSGGDLNNASAVNLTGGTLEVLTDAAFNKTFTSAVSVTAASALAYNNSTATTQTLTFSGTNGFALSADLTVQNISSDTTLNNLFNISRAITGTGAVVVETYNNVAAAGDNFTRGRVQLSGDNSAWSGGLVIAKGTAQISGATAAGTGTIVIGKTGDAFGAALALNQVADYSAANAITVRSGGFRAIKNNGAAGLDISFTGDVALEGSLTLDHSLDAGKSITLAGDISGVGGLTIVRSAGDVASFARLSGVNTYTGATLVSSGRLLVDGSLASGSAVTVSSGAALGGDGSIAGSLNFASGAGFLFNPLTTLTVSGSVTFGGFSVLDLIGLDSNTVAGSYMLLDGTGSNISTTNVSNIGSFNSLDLGSGKNAYFDFTNGDLSLIVIPEPSTYALAAGAVFLGAAVVRRRSRNA